MASIYLGFTINMKITRIGDTSRSQEFLLVTFCLMNFLGTNINISTALRDMFAPRLVQTEQLFIIKESALRNKLEDSLKEPNKTRESAGQTISAAISLIGRHCQ